MWLPRSPGLDAVDTKHCRGIITTSCMQGPGRKTISSTNSDDGEWSAEEESESDEDEEGDVFADLSDDSEAGHQGGAKKKRRGVKPPAKKPQSQLSRRAAPAVVVQITACYYTCMVVCFQGHGGQFTFRICRQPRRSKVLRGTENKLVLPQRKNLRFLTRSGRNRQLWARRMFCNRGSVKYQCSL